VFRSRADRAREGPATPTTARALEVLPSGGTVLDVGCGAGATSLPLADRAGTMIGVDAASDMVAAFVEAVNGVGRVVATVEGSWPEIAADAPPADVVVCGHVLYNVQELVPFVQALDEHARRRVVLELTEHHPLRWMNDLWLRFHDVVFPEGPTAEVAEQVLRDAGHDAHRDERPPDDLRGHGGFARRGDAVALIRRRLCLGPDRDDEVAAALGDLLHRDDRGRWSAGPGGQAVVTLWWDAGP
jgi:SAM-dependent methyltransferase